jgi:hypothetical protein
MTVAEPVPLRSTIPARLDRLKWSPFHTRMAAGLGAAWIPPRMACWVPAPRRRRASKG